MKKNVEWSLATEFAASDTFLRKWADAQKFTFGKGAGWFVSRLSFFLFFNFYFRPVKKSVINQLIDLI